MNHPWTRISLTDYENHMKQANIRQQQTLANIMRNRLENPRNSVVIILGIAGGNGLEFAQQAHIKKILGIDVNESYLQTCRMRFAHLGERLELSCADLTDPQLTLPACELLTADLLIEYIGIGCFVSLIRRSRPLRISCTLQSDGPKKSFVSVSQYADKFDGLSEIHETISPNDLSEALAKLDYQLTKKTVLDLPNGKAFICLDFSAQA